MRKITKIIVLAVVLFSVGNVAKAQAVSAYCGTTVTHFNIAAEIPSGIKLTISKIDATSMYIEIESATADPVDLLLVNGGSGATISAPDVSVAGKIKRTLTWTTAPASVSIELLWSKVTMGGNWMLNTFVVPFDATCTGGVVDTTLPVIGSASVVGSPTFNSVNLLLAATDNLTSPVISYIANDATNGITNKAITADATGNATVTGLAASTSYNLIITAKDAAGNISANSTTVSFTTPVEPPLSTIDFETVGHDWTWVVTENAPNTPALQFVDNPSTTGINLSTKAAKFTANSTGNPWALTYTDNRTFIISNNNKIVKVMVYKDRISDFAVKYEGPGYARELKVANTLINQWEEIIFSFGADIGKTVTRIVIIPDFLARATATLNYFDNISFSNGLTTLLGSNNTDNSIRCYPNPMDNTLNVSSSTEINQVIVRNILGQTIKTITVNQLEKSIDFSTISTGNYFVTVKLDNGQFSTQKIVKL